VHVFLCSLESQGLSLIVTSEKPEVEEQRVNLLKLQGEQSVKLRELEEQMLAKISEVKGSILDDDQVVEGMEILTKEGLQVENQIEKSAQVMAEVDRVISKFKPLGRDSREIFVLLERLHNLLFLYEFSSNFFMKILEKVLSATAKVTNEVSEERIANLKKQLYIEVSARVSRALTLEDKMVFNILLANLFKGCNMQKSSDLSIGDIAAYIEEVFGANFPWQGRGLDYLQQVTEQEIDSTTPLLFCSAPGHDVSERIEEMARTGGKDLAAVAMGSEEGYATAEKILSSAAKQGSWVMLKNCHYCTEWLQEILVKRLHALSPHSNFRIFLTSEINPKLPISLLRMSDLILAEAPGGVKASLSRFFKNISADRFKVPVINRLYFLLSWIHSVIQERLRYVPGGWSKHYDFTEADASYSLDVIDSLCDVAVGSRHNISSDKLPWEAIRATLCTGIFGGKITDEEDQGKLKALVYSVFVSESFDINFRLIPEEDSVPAVPESSYRDDFISWIDSLPDYTSPTWIGLDASAEDTLAKNTAKSVLRKVSFLETLSVA
jgi:dynein heavy chain 1